MMILQVAAVVALIVIIIDIVFGKVGKKKTNIPAGPRGLPLVGNLVDAYLQGEEAHVYLRNLSQKYGPLATLHHGSTPVLVVSSMKMANQILKSNDASFCSRPSVLGQQKLSYSGIDMAFSPFNNHWKEMRKLCAVHLLSPKQVLSFRPTREDEVSRMIAKINAGDRPVNLSAVAMSLASNLITRVAFGRRYDDHEYEKKRLDRLIMEAQALMVSFYFSDHFPALGWLDKASGLLGRLRKNCEELDVFYQQLIEEHRSPTRQVDSREDIIDLMIQLKHEDTTARDWDDRIKALLMNLFIAATDTVAAAIVWSMTALMQNPSVMKKVQTEIRGLGERSLVSEDDIKELRYLEAVVLEALRLYPPAPLLYRTQILGGQECTRVEGYDIEPGTEVIINGWAIGRDPERWENAEEFEPERFMRMQRRDALEMMLPFGGGRRGCPGKEMGLISIQLALANLLYSFDWALPLPEKNRNGNGNENGIIDTHALPGLTMHKKNALLLLPTPYHYHLTN